MAAIVGAGAIVWAGGTAAAALTGTGDPAPPFGLDAAITLVTDGPAGLWPTTSPTAVWIAVGILAAAGRWQWSRLWS